MGWNSIWISPSHTLVSPPMFLLLPRLLGEGKAEQIPRLCWFVSTLSVVEHTGRWGPAALQVLDSVARLAQANIPDVKKGVFRRFWLMKLGCELQRGMVFTILNNGQGWNRNQDNFLTQEHPIGTFSFLSLSLSHFTYLGLVAH